ncbi:MAG: sterol desaturase family protein [Geminicoccaceae bacterium]
MTFETAATIKLVLALGGIITFAFWERIWPSVDHPLLVRLGRAGRDAWRRLAKNLGLLAFNIALGPLIVLPITLWADGFSLGLRPDIWAGWWGLILDVLVLDLWIYWWHRANHEIQILWRFHEVHHLDEFLDSSSAFRFHFGEVVLSALARALLIILFDIPVASVILFEGLIAFFTVFHHSDARLPERLERPLSKVVVTPSIHWVHHHALRADTDSNYGTVFSFWDRLFRSLSATRRWAGMKIGVERRSDRSFRRLLLSPFLRS